MVYGDQKTKKEEKEFLKHHLKCYGSLNTPIDCKCPLYHECSLEALKRLINIAQKRHFKP